MLPHLGHGNDAGGRRRRCGLPEIDHGDHKCVVYSFGSHGQDVFERHIESVNPGCEARAGPSSAHGRARYVCACGSAPPFATLQVHVFDPTSQPLEHWNYHSMGLCEEGDSFNSYGESYPCKPLEEHIKELGHKHIDILKMGKPLPPAAASARWRCCRC